MKQNPMPWFEIYVEDMKRAIQFYEGLLGITFKRGDMSNDEMEMYLFPGEVELPGASGALIAHSMRRPSAEGHLLYFSVPDCAEQAQWAADQGCQIYAQKMSIGEHGFIAITSDSEGNVIGLHSCV